LAKSQKITKLLNITQNLRSGKTFTDIKILRGKDLRPKKR